MQIDVLTLFPKMFSGPFAESIVKRAQDKGLVKIKIHNLRDWVSDKHKTVDDRPFGGGPGMILKVEPVYKALEDLRTKELKNQRTKIVLLTPQGKPFNQKIAKRLSKLNHLIFICGHYEGVDERIREHLVDEEISIGDYVLTGGELPAMVLVDSVVRLISGVLEKPKAIKSESFSEGKLEYSQYTRPENFQGWKVPKILLSGHHAEIEKWREKQAIERTKKRRPDLLRPKTKDQK